MKEKVGFIGLGLIGGSLAKAIRTYYKDINDLSYGFINFLIKIKKLWHSLPRNPSLMLRQLLLMIIFATVPTYFYARRLLLM